MLKAGHARISAHKIPNYINCRKQKFRTTAKAPGKEHILEYQPDELDEGFQAVKSKKSSKYKPVKLCNDEMQKELSKILKDQVLPVGLKFNIS